MSITVFGDHEPRVVDQLRRCVEQEEGSRGVLCADGHFGYSAPIGGVVAYRDHVSPAAVGYDIGCGNLAVATSLHNDGDFKKALPGLMDRIFKEISFGMGRNDGKSADHPVIDEIRHADFEPQRKLANDAGRQLGTVGAGNHYVDLFADETNRVWIGVHFGSRGFGHRTASGFLAMAKGQSFTDRVPEGEMEAPPDVLRVDSSLGWAYIAAMKLAGRYAHAGREVVVQQVLGILGAQVFGEPVHNHHNYAWLEQHSGESFWVVRKGATPAFPGQLGFVGATMGEPAVILQGVDSPMSVTALRSTVHGAGRAMSRTAAAGKTRKRWACNNRDCDWVQPPFTQKPEECPDCSNTSFSKRWVKETEGAINWDSVLEYMKDKGIELRGANAEEAPGAYKRLDEVLADHAGTVEIIHTLTPLGVAMAPGNIRDPYKD
jgi:tRNA-splicing ligase RtcB